ncbi:MAG: DUF2147 domain-containing protein [Acidiferrobacteraceae bacterium]
MARWARFAILLLVTVVPVGAFAATPIGVWATKDDRAHVRISPCGRALCGTLVWLRHPLRNGHPKTDRHDPERRLRSRPLVGLKILKGFTPAAHHGLLWTHGLIYDPASGKTYHGTITMEPGGKLGLRGYIGWSVFGRTETWTRVRPGSRADTPGLKPGKRS